MRVSRAVLPVALAIGVIAAPATAGAAGPGHPRAKASGTDGPPAILPSIVRGRIDRGEKALERAADYVDRDMPEKAVASLLNVRRNMYAAWRGAVDVVENAPAPPPPADRAQKGRVPMKARASVKARASAAYLGGDETAVAVLNFQHDVATGAFGLLDGAKGVLRDSVSKTMFAALNRRDQAILYIHNRPVPAPPADKALTRDEVTVPSFADLMPGIVSDLDDELGQAKGLLRGGALTPGEKRIMGQARSQTLETKDQVNTWWPPLPAGDG
jgi:hypothetical protein